MRCAAAVMREWMHIDATFENWKTKKRSIVCSESTGHNYLFKMTEMYCPCFVVSRFKLTKKVKDQIRHGYFNCFAKKHCEIWI